MEKRFTQFTDEELKMLWHTIEFSKEYSGDFESEMQMEIERELKSRRFHTEKSGRFSQYTNWIKS